MEMDKKNHKLIIWHVDEVFVHAFGRFYYLWDVIDQDSKCIEIHLGKTRGMDDCIAALRKAREHGIPDIIVTDDWVTYPRAIRKVFGKGRGCLVKHVQAHFKPVIVRYKGYVLAISNNRIEGFNSWLRNHYSCLRGFKSEKYMNMWLEGFKIVWNSKYLFIIN